MVSSLPVPSGRAISQGQQQRAQAKKTSNSPQHYFNPIRKDPPNESVARSASNVNLLLVRWGLRDLGLLLLLIHLR